MADNFSDSNQSPPLPLVLVAELPDLMRPQDYPEADGEKKKIRLRITMNPDGIEILGDALHVTELEKLLAAAGDRCNRRPMARTLCG